MTVDGQEQKYCVLFSSMETHQNRSQMLPGNILTGTNVNSEGCCNIPGQRAWEGKELWIGNGSNGLRHRVIETCKGTQSMEEREPGTAVHANGEGRRRCNQQIGSEMCRRLDLSWTFD